jgi:hypothetical protein
LDSEWERLRDALLAVAAQNEAIPGQLSAFGQKFEISANVLGPSGQEARLVTVWMVTNGEKVPHFVTAFPG